jgi:hypothetical protein
MRVIPGEFAHALEILKDLSEQNQAEHDQLGLSQWDVLKLVKKFLDQGSAYTGFDKGAPACMLGVIQEDGESRTWFLATKAYFSIGPRAIIHARRFLRDAYKTHGKLFTGSCSPHPEAERWFDALGYRKMGEADGVKWFVYEMTEPHNSAKLPSPSKRYGPEVAAPGSDKGR